MRQILRRRGDPRVDPSFRWCSLSACRPLRPREVHRLPAPTFTPELSASRSPFSSSGITTVATERFHRWDFHPLERQLASLHGLLHPLQHAGLSRRSPRSRQSTRQASLGHDTDHSFPRDHPHREVSCRRRRSLSLIISVISAAGRISIVPHFNFTPGAWDMS